MIQMEDKMTLKTFLTICVLGLSPTLALASPEGCSHGDRTEAMTCMEGFVIDATTGTCVEQVSS